ncbi:MAG: hypothetical protein K0U39_01490 [Alphaproteobacteria bacterium]|nr:hypothetical protein [Alphaproteobacteria bacterium]
MTDSKKGMLMSQITEITLEALFSKLNEINNLTKQMSDMVHEDLNNSSINFTMDGHLLGDIGVCLASYMFDLQINTKGSNAGFDAITKDDKKKVEIKFRKATDQLAISKSSIQLSKKENLYLIVFTSNDKFEIKLRYNGLLSDNLKGKLKNYRISLSQLPTDSQDDRLDCQNDIDKVNAIIRQALIPSK